MATVDKVTPLLDLKQTAERLGFSENYVRRLLREGVIPGFQLGNAWRCDPDALEKWLGERSNQK